MVASSERVILALSLIEMEEKCRICELCVAAGMEKKRRKMLFGKGCDTVRKVLNAELLSLFGLELKDFFCEEVSSFICRHCDLKLTKINKLSDQISSLKEEIKPYLEALQSSRSPATLATSRKRALPSDAAGVEVTAKQPCRESSLSVPSSTSPAISVSEQNFL